MTSEISLQKNKIDTLISSRSLDPLIYWNALLKYLEGCISQLDLFSVVEEYLGTENSIFCIFIPSIGA